MCKFGVPTADEVLGQDRLPFLVDVCPTVDLERRAFIVTDTVRVEGGIPPHFNLPLLQVFDKKTLYHTLVHKQNVRIEHVDNGRIMHFAAEAVEGLVDGTAPEGNVVDSDTALEQRVSQSHLAERFDRLGLQAVRSISNLSDNNNCARPRTLHDLPSYGRLIRPVVYNLDINAKATQVAPQH